MTEGTASHEILCSDKALVLRGNFTRQLGIAWSVVDFNSFFKGLVVASGNDASFLLFNGEILKVGPFSDKLFLGAVFFSD